MLVFRKGGRLAGIEKWHVGGGGKLEVVTEYNYLVLLFSTKLNTNAMLRQVFSKAKSAFCRITRLSNNLNNMSFIVLCKIFDAQIEPILLYGSELWGLDDMSIIESVPIFSLKKNLMYHYLRQTSWSMVTLAYTSCELILFFDVLNTG